MNMPTPYYIVTGLAVVGLVLVVWCVARMDARDKQSLLILAWLVAFTASAQVVTQTVNDAYFGWHGGTNRLMPSGFAQYRGQSFAWHLDNPTGDQVRIYDTNENVQAQFDEPGGFGSCSVARAWSVQSHASNVIVAIIDDSFDLGHPDLAGRWWINPSTGVPGIRIASGVESTNANLNNDTKVHGTQASGIIGAIGNNSIGVVGVCKDGVQIMPIACAGSNADLGRGVLWAATNGADIILFAYGFYTQEPLWTNAFVVAQQRGCLVINAVVENGGSATTSHDIGGEFTEYHAFDYPCMWGRNLTTNVIPHLTNLLTVTCSTMEEVRYAIGGWSTNFVDLMYPGRRIPSTQPPSTYAAFNGTSPASAVAAGHAALLKERFRHEAMWQIKERIMATVQVRTNYFTNCLSSGQGDVFTSMVWQRPPPPYPARGFRIN